MKRVLRYLLGVVLILGLVGLAAGGEEANPKEGFAAYYLAEHVQVSPSVPGYTLPLTLGEIGNLDTVDALFRLNTDQKELLGRNGFTVIPYLGCDDIVKPYKDLKELNEDLKERGESEIGIFVTSDTLLHLYHILFNETLKEIEEWELFYDVKAMSRAMMETSLAQYQALSGELKEAAKRNTAFFAVALKLLDPDAEIPEPVKGLVGNELVRIELYNGFSESPIFCYQEDYSQYVPRGHYTRSFLLENYFKAMMWYGRIAFLLKGGEGALVSADDARIQTLQASLISGSMDSVTVDGSTVAALWNRIYGVMSFFVGVADDLTPYEYKEAILKLFGEGSQSQLLLEGDNFLRLRAELAGLRLPQIYGGTGFCVIEPPPTPEKVDQCLSESQGMRFMGQRFVPDSYIFQNLVGLPYTGAGEPFTMEMTLGGPARCFPRGLDVMALLGSKRAGEILEAEGDTDYQGYGEQFAALSQEFLKMSEQDWHRNLYWGWLYSLKALLGEYPPGYPTFMSTPAWQDKELNTALASWAQLRHDTILFAKQSYMPFVTAIGEPLQVIPVKVVGYVEPVPEFYARILALTRMAQEGLSAMEMLSYEQEDRFAQLEELLGKLKEIAIKELANEPLSDEEYNFIGSFGEELERVILEIEMEGKETTVVADVHTDLNSGQVLEEGVGYVDMILVAYRVPGTGIILGAGPVLSYYEFKQPTTQRLTNEAWKEMLRWSPPTRQGWSASFFAPNEQAMAEEPAQQSVEYATLTLFADCGPVRMMVNGRVITAPEDRGCFSSPVTLRFPKGTLITLRVRDLMRSSCGMLQIMVSFEYWEINGRRYPGGPVVTFPLAGDTVAIAIYQP